jgi:hypothetical protein
MSSSETEPRHAEALNVTVTDDTLTVDLVDGRTPTGDPHATPPHSTGTRPTPTHPSKLARERPHGQMLHSNQSATAVAR